MRTTVGRDGQSDEVFKAAVFATVVAQTAVQMDRAGFEGEVMEDIARQAMMRLEEQTKLNGQHQSLTAAREVLMMSMGSSSGRCSWGLHQEVGAASVALQAAEESLKFNQSLF